MTDYTRVFTEGGTVAHLLEPLASPNSKESASLCGRSAWPGYWHGTGTQDELERAMDLKVCVGCGSVVLHRSSGVITR